MSGHRRIPIMTPTEHERAAFAAMHGFDLLYSAWSLGLGSSRCSGASSLASSAATPPRLLLWPPEKADWEKNHPLARYFFSQYPHKCFSSPPPLRQTPVHPAMSPLRA